MVPDAHAVKLYLLSYRNTDPPKTISHVWPCRVDQSTNRLIDNADRYGRAMMIRGDCDSYHVITG
jgi:hypothetical protein